jgi:hypothetical protein
MQSLNLFEIFGILLAHGYFDFVLQTDEQAINKSKDNKFLTEHVITYSIGWLWLSIIYLLLFKDFHILLFPLITFVCHWITDYFTSRINAKLWTANKRHEFFVAIEIDQLLHYLQLFITYYLLKN